MIGIFVRVVIFGLGVELGRELYKTVKVKAMGAGEKGKSHFTKGAPSKSGEEKSLGEDDQGENSANTGTEDNSSKTEGDSGEHTISSAPVCRNITRRRG